MTTGKNTISDNMVTYSSGAKYTLYMNLGNYIPAEGTLKIKIPSEIQIVSE